MRKESIILKVTYEIFENLHEATKDMNKNTYKSEVDIKYLKNKAMDEYWEYQAVMAGQSLEDENNIKIKFDVYASALGMSSEDLWSECENNHEGMLGI